RGLDRGRRRREPLDQQRAHLSRTARAEHRRKARERRQLSGLPEATLRGRSSMSLSTPPPTTGFPIVDRLLDGTAPAAARAAAARGALPVPREVLVPVLVRLVEDAEQSIATAARQTLEGYPSEEMTGILADPRTDP